MDITVRRNGQDIDVQVEPVKNVAGEYKLGIWVRDNAQGLGTITFLNADICLAFGDIFF